jgi:bile acid-coenzyme A ligase
MPKMSHGQAMGWLAEQEPDRLAVIHGDDRVTRQELERRSNRLARGYAERGVGPGALVTLALPNGIEFLVATLAVWKLGGCPQPISARLPERERRAIVELAKPALIVGVAAGEYGDAPSVPPGFAPAAALSDEPLPDVVPPNVRTMTSGGSTGRPKLIVDLTPALADPTVAENGMQLRGTTLVPGPLYHAGPFIVSWQCLLSGGTLILTTRFEPEECLRLIERHRVDWALFVPTMMQRIWKLPSEVRARTDVSSLRRVMCTGAPSPAWLKRAWIEWIGAEKVWEAYGGTERIAGTLISGSEWLAHPGSVGRPTLGRKIRILDADGKDCGPREVGEVFMLPAAGRGTTYRYLGAEAAASADGWESLGDMGYLDEDGYLYLVERKTDMVVVGGSNVYPAEVEAALDAHPEVRSSAVIGLPDEDLGQRLHAIYEADAELDAAELRAHLASHLAPHKIPRSFERVAEPLRDDAGKVRRSALREARPGVILDHARRVPGPGSRDGVRRRAGPSSSTARPRGSCDGRPAQGRPRRAPARQPRRAVELVHGDLAGSG